MAKRKPRMDTIRYGGAFIGDEEVNAIIKTINKDRRNWQAGPESKKMEEECAKYLGVKHGILTNSGSSAGLLVLSALELPRGSEVIISAVTFPTIFNIILQCDLVPVVVDADPMTNNIHIEDIEKAITKKTKAIIAIHILGNPCDMPKIMKIAKKHKLYVIEDNCDGFGSSLNNHRVGSFGDISITSFHAAHIVSMGVGGGVFTNDNKIAQKVRQYRDWGRQANTKEPHKVKELPFDYNPRYVYDKIGYNFQILEIQAAMGRVQLRKVGKIKALRKANFNYLSHHLEKLPGIVIPYSIKGADTCWFGLPIICQVDRAGLVAHLEKNGIETRSMFSGDITRHPAYKNSEYRVSGKLSGANYILNHSFFIGVHPSMTKEQREYVVKTFNDYFTISNASASNK